MTIEPNLVTALLGLRNLSPYMTDAYKLSMAVAGFPLRTETFCFYFRRPGWYFQPFDLHAVVLELLSRRSMGDVHPNDRRITPAMEAAFMASPGSVESHALPAGSWFLGGEPILTLTGPSFLVSMLEPIVLWLSYAIQVATALRNGWAVTGPFACDDELTIARLVSEITDRPLGHSQVAAFNSYRADVVDATRQIVWATGDRDRIIEGGLRGVSCMARHLLAWQACQHAGLTLTSNLHATRTAVGTAGHEHGQRHGSDLAAFRAFRDAVPGRCTVPVDTFDPMGSGIPALEELMREDPTRQYGARFDSGDRIAQATAVARFAGPDFRYVFSGDFDAAQVGATDAACQAIGIRPDQRFYLVGGAIVSPPDWQRHSRGLVGAVYKLSETGGRPTMKTGAGPKNSIPGRPVVFRLVSGAGPEGLVGQDGEAPPPGYVQLTDGEPVVAVPDDGGEVEWSNETKARAVAVSRGGI